LPSPMDSSPTGWSRGTNRAGRFQVSLRYSVERWRWDGAVTGLEEVCVVQLDLVPEAYEVGLTPLSVYTACVGESCRIRYRRAALPR